jgi:hypothetical protein
MTKHDGSTPEGLRARREQALREATDFDTTGASQVLRERGLSKEGGPPLGDEGSVPESPTPAPAPARESGVTRKKGS